MPNPNFMILFVDSPAVSAAFYKTLFDREPVEASPTFALFALDSGLMLGLWSRHTAEYVVTRLRLRARQLCRQTFAP